MSNLRAIDKYIVFIAFVISGFAGLIYESVWSHYLGLFLGHAAFAQTLTLAIFMGGMAFGAWFVNRKIDLIKNAVMVYAIIELILGFYGLNFHKIFDFSINASLNHVFPAIQSETLIEVVKWGIASLLILPQSILLGATFPLLSSGIIRRAGNAEGKIISRLYFSNSFGAAFGALFSTFVFIPVIGMPGALLVAGVLNIFVAIAVYYVAKTKEQKFENQRTEALQKNFNHPNISKSMVLLIAGATGFASFVYEISWIRMLNLVLGTTLHSFEIMLSSFILGLALGGLWISKRIEKIKDIGSYLGVIQICMGGLAILTIPLYLESFTWVAEILQNVLKNTTEGYVFYNIMTAALSILIMMPAAFFAGMTLPLLTMILMHSGDKEKSIGKVYSANTVGSLLGVWFATHIGMVVLGLKSLLIFASMIDFLIGIFLIYRAKRIKAMAWAPGIYLVLLALIVVFTQFSPSVLSSGTYRYARSDFNDSSEVVFYEDGKSASISVVKNVNKGKETLVISTNGKPDASTILSEGDYSADEPTMVLLAALPQIYKPDAKTVANIGFGSGITAHVLLASEELTRLDVIEIEPEMIEGAKLFKPKNLRVFEDPRSNVVIDDAKTFFSKQKYKYDVIVSEPSNPWVIGVGNLFTAEFYDQMKNYLNPDGLLVQWLHVYEMSPEVLATAINAISQEFEHYDVYLAVTGDIIILASMVENKMDLSKGFSQVSKQLKQDLKDIDIDDVSLITSRKIGSRDIIARLFSSYSSSVNSDYYPLLTINAPEDRFKKVNSARLFHYNTFSLPIYEYIGSTEGFIEAKTRVPDKYHPLLAGYQSSMALLKYIENKDVRATTNISMANVGYVDQFSQADQLCGSENSNHEEVWLASFVTLFNGVINTGSGAGQQLLDSAEVIACYDALNSEEIRSVLDAYSMFANKDYGPFIQTALPLVAEEAVVNYEVKKYMFNNILFAVIQSQKIGLSFEQEFLTHLVDDFDTLWNPQTIWLASQIKND